MCVASCVRLYAAYYCGSYHAVIMYSWLKSISITPARVVSNMASASDEYSASALKCQCTGCSNCNEWRTADTPINVAWFRKTRGRCGGDVKKRNYMNYGCAWCSACYAAGAGETAALPAHGPPLLAAAPSEAEAQVPPGLPLPPSDEAEEQVPVMRTELVAMQARLDMASHRISTLESAVDKLTCTVLEMQAQIQCLHANHSSRESSASTDVEASFVVTQAE